MMEKLPFAANTRISGMRPGSQLLVALLFVIIVFAVAYPVFLLIGSLLGVDLNALADAAKGLKAFPGSLKYLQVAQHISLFILPVLVWSYFSGAGLAGFSGLDRFPRSEHITLVLFVSLLLLPVNSYASYLNSGMEIADWLSGLESWLKVKEQQGEYLIAMIIVADSLPVMLINLVVLAIIPAIGEELFFRGLLQRQLKLIIGWPHLTVFLTAVVFSALHFQFYGFLPRFILGLVYGYLFMWSGSVWLPIIAHMANNTAPVILTYFYGWDKVSKGSLDQVAERPIFPALSLIAVVFLMIYAARILKSRRI
jgi:membrane protease YdiL (CAAX protease family)